MRLCPACGGKEDAREDCETCEGHGYVECEPQDALGIETVVGVQVDEQIG